MFFCILCVSVPPHRKLAHRTGLRITEIDVIDDSFQWKSWSAWLARSLGFVGLLGLWVPFIYLLFFCPDCYTPPGQIIDIRKHRNAHPAKYPQQLVDHNKQQPIQELPPLLERSDGRESTTVSTTATSVILVPSGFENLRATTFRKKKNETKGSNNNKNENGEKSDSVTSFYSNRNFDEVDIETGSSIPPPPPIQDKAMLL